MTTQEAVDAGEVVVIAPAGFAEHTVAENVFAGTAMSRRSVYMFGSALPRGASGHVGVGLGLATSGGTAGLIVPTHSVTFTGQTLTVDGVEIEFQLTPETEAPADLNLYLPRFRALGLADNAVHTMHNLVTLRGALVRDAHAWAGYLTEALDAYADRSDVAFAGHTWPVWGSERVAEYLGQQRDLYAYLHDQTVRLINAGQTGVEIAETLQLPPALENAWHARGYYGSVSHNVKAIYQRYLGWFDGNPARLWPHPPTEQARRYVEAFGGLDRLLERAREAHEAGDYRWAATLLDHAVFAEPDHAGARALLADTLDQLAYATENAIWRNFFLTGALELREGRQGTSLNTNAPGLVAQLTPEQLFDKVAFSVNGPRAWGLDATIDVTLSDLGRTHRLILRNGVLTHRALDRIAEPAAPDAALTLTRARLVALLQGDTAAGGVEIAGNPAVLAGLLGVLDAPDPAFNIVVP